MITLSKIFSRERPLIHFAMWDESDRLGFKRFLNHKLRHNLFLRKGNKTSVWYDLSEIEEINGKIRKKLEAEESFLGVLIHALDEYWKDIFPYVSRKREFESAAKVKKYYSALVNWWSAMTVLFNIPDIESVPDSIKKKALEVRKKYERYSSATEEPIVEFWNNRNPEHKEFGQVILPDEIGKLTEKKTEELSTRLDGCAIFDGKLIQLNNLNKALKESDITLEGAEIKLSKTFSREHSLFYCYIWHDANKKYMKKWVESNVKNILFTKDKKTNKISVWYDKNELNSFSDALAKRINSDKSYFKKIKDEFYNLWKVISPYMREKKEIKNINELERFYNACVKWWAPMAAIYLIVDITNVSRDVQAEAFRIRAETQDYSDALDNVFIKFFQKHFPEYSHLTFVISPSEVFLLKKKRPTKSELGKIKKRLDGYALLNNRLFPIAAMEKRLKEHNLTLEEVEASRELRELKGTPASKGFAKGNVRLVLLKKQISELREGEILVTEMTTPEFVPAMKKAAAIVTDEGGITSHAAIISRELKKPCIIGTKIATKVLKDGDFVEVDAEKGIVRKLK